MDAISGIWEDPTDEDVSELLATLDYYVEFTAPAGLVYKYRWNSFDLLMDPMKSQAVLDILALAS